LKTAVATPYIAAAVHLVLLGHPVERVEPNPNERGKLVFHFGEGATDAFREYQTALRELRTEAYIELRKLGWL
jgi:hypothetical protein